ncbi:hypothetical protein EJ04DRAFT_273544 [Polyplosphaeria fusca]|uniref:Protein kinase domain-containing protein n=1 Tax=Polyplosphaeria fusca TaxID=682080 RepID=A0A9P4QXL0_9PLEO|nr:hypothetical protein EJ04DRAFT_273544 [Polyplosphaeria fusca]
MSVVGEAAGLGLAAVSLLAGFEGALKGYLLIEGMFDKDNGIRDLALDYRIECEKLRSWGDRFKINAAREENCLLYNEKPQIKRLMAEIFGRIHKLHEEANGYVKEHKAADYAVDYEGLQKPSASFTKFLQANGPEVETLSQAQSSKKQHHRIKWVIKNKAKFEEVVRRLRKANEDLLGLLSIPSLETFNRALPGYVLAFMSGQDLQQTIDSRASKDDLIRQVAQLKLLQLSRDDQNEPTKIERQNLEPTNPAKSATSRDIWIYNLVARVWVEWLEIESTLSPTETHQLRSRIKTLAVMLESAPPTFSMAKCIGYFEDAAHPLRTGIVYSLPIKPAILAPISLLAMITQHASNKSIPEPPLGQKFRLAQTLATALMQLHACNWLHKGFRSDNIIFLTTPGSASASRLEDPKIAGFEYARDVTMQSIGYRPNGSNPLDYYYHPDVTSGFSKTLDLYSLGVVLLELALWRPLSAKIPANRKGSLEAINAVLLETVDGAGLDAEVGTVYADVVRKCLRCDFPSAKYEAEFTCAMNTEVVLQLEQCVA